jgi:peptide-methionine (R)-S-oxide reductase
MTRLSFLLFCAIASLGFVACSFSTTNTSEPTSQLALNTDEQQKPAIKQIIKTDAEWKEILTPEEYRVLREAGTERAFTGDLLDNKKEGTYVCAACAHPLFAQSTKFKSGTGWPSFYAPISDTAVVEHIDESYGMRRTEILCAKCNGHQGHVFGDGPKPTGLRYCINSVSMNFVPEK